MVKEAVQERRLGLNYMVHAQMKRYRMCNYIKEIPLLIYLINESQVVPGIHITVSLHR